MYFTNIIIIKFILSFVLINILPAIGIIFYLFRNNKRLGSIDKIILSSIVSSPIFIVISFSENYASIPQNKIVIIINILAMIALSLFILQKHNLWKCFKKKLLLKEIKNFNKLFIYAIFLALIFFRVFPVTNTFVPITADPMAHSEWLRTLNTTFHTTTDFWYPQGLVYFLNYYATLVAPIYPKLVLIFTNLFSAVFPISFFYFIFLVTSSNFKNSKKLVFPLLAFVIASFVPYPKNLYFTFGKNSFIFALSLLPILFLLLEKIKNSKLHFFLFAIFSFAIFLIHYPTGAFAYILLSVFLILKLFYFKNKRLRIKKGVFIPILVFILTTILLSAILFINIFSIYKNHPPSEDKSVTEAAYSIKNPASFVLNNFWTSQIEVYKYKPCLTAKFIYGKNICRKKFNIDKDSQVSLFYIFVISLLFFIMKLFTTKKQKELFVFNKLIIGFVLLFIFTSLSFKLSSVIGMFFYLELSLFSVFIFILISAWFFSEIIYQISNRKIYTKLFIFIIILIFLIINLQSYSIYLKKGKKASTKYADIKSFEFIKNNIPENKKILVKLYNISDKIIAGGDSGIWIPSYTGRQIEVDWLHFSSNKSFEIYYLFKKLTKDPNDIKSIKKLVCNYNIGYVFSGSNRKRKSTTIKFDDSKYFKNIYNKNSTRIEKIINIKCN